MRESEPGERLLRRRGELGVEVGDGVAGGVGQRVGDGEDEAEGRDGRGVPARVEIGLMVIEDGLLDGRGEVPFGEGGGAELGVRGVDDGVLALLEGLAAGGAHGVDAEVFLGQGGGDHEAAEVVEKAGGEGALRVLSRDFLDDAVGEQGGGEGVLVEAGHGPGLGRPDAGPETGDGEAEQEVAELVDAEDGDGGADAADIAAAPVEGGVDQAEDVAAEDGVALDQISEMGEADVLVGERGHEVIEDRRERRKLVQAFQGQVPGRDLGQDGMAHIRVHRQERGRS